MHMRMCVCVCAFVCVCERASLADRQIIGITVCQIPPAVQSEAGYIIMEKYRQTNE